MTGISLTSLPKGSKLMLIGDWYRKPGKGWYVACYFLSERRKLFRKGMPVDLLPALIPGHVYPRTSVENTVKGYTGTFKVPLMESWEQCRYVQLPESLKRMHTFSDQINDLIVYKLDPGERVIWLPAIELARILCFHSSEVVRAAVYQGNTWQLAKSAQKSWVGEVEFTSNVPVNYLNSLQFRKFFAWLLFDVDAEESFCSIFNLLNQNAFIQNGCECWTFEIKTPDLSACEISWAGYTGSVDKDEKHHCYVREIRSIAGLPAPQLETIVFSHPDDVLFLGKESEKNSDKEKKERQSVCPKEIDPYNSPKAGSKRYLLYLSPAGFYFDTEIDLRRSPRQVRALPQGESPKLDEFQEEIVGITEGSNDGKRPRADIDNLVEPELIDAPEKIAFFQTMLEKLEAEHGWKIQTKTGVVPKKRCKSLHLIDGQPRQYCLAEVTRNSDSTVQILEIELSKKENLSTLFYRANNRQSAVDEILNALMFRDTYLKQYAMKWKRKINADLTISRCYLDHPDKKIKSETEALEAWVARAAQKINSL